jgi:hypothetical protein
MPLDEPHAARRRAELLWQQQTRDTETREAAAQAEKLAAQKEGRAAIDAKTARLRALRLAKEAADRAARSTSVRRLRRRAGAATGLG